MRSSSSPVAHQIELFEKRLELMLRDLRKLRHEVIAETRDHGVLGSRGLTQFIVDQLKSDRQRVWRVVELLMAAERAGYAIPTTRIMSKRLSSRVYRVGDIEWNPIGGWQARMEGAEDNG